jgi:hypothetical protein
MIEVMDGFPGEVLAVRATGHVSGRDYRDTLIPEALMNVERHGSLRMIFLVDRDFAGFVAAGWWADVRLGMRHWGEFGRVAIVTDLEPVATAARLFRPLFRHSVRVFPLEAIPEATRWVSQHAADAARHQLAQ